MSLKKVAALAILGLFAFATVGCNLFAKKAATVNGTPIYQSAVDKQMNRITKQHKTAEQEAAFKKQKAQIQKQIVDLLVDEEIYNQEGAKLNIKVTDAQVEKEVTATVKRFPSQKDFDKALSDAGMTMQDLRDFTKNRMITDAVNKKVVGTITVSAKEVKDYYDKNTAQFKDPEKIKVSHILYPGDAAGLAKAQEAITKLNNGADFAELAKAESTDPSTKANGGDLGFVQKGVMAAEFETAAFALAVGEWTQAPVKTQFGYHVIKVFDKTPEKQKTFEESKSSIEQMLKSQKESAKIKTWLDGVKKKAKIVKY